MSDNTRGGSNDAALPLISTEEVTTLNGGAVTAQQVQRIIPAVRTADSTAVDVTAAAPLPVVQTGPPGLPTGASTAANQSTIIGHLDGVEGLLTTIDGDTGTLAAAVAGSEMQVDIVGALPAGANAIGKLAANSGVDIGDVDVTSLPALPAGNNNIGDVDVASIAAGTALVGNVGTDQTRISVTPTVSTSPAYTAKDAVGGIMEFANAVNGSGKTGIIQTVVVVDKSQQMPAMDLVLFDQTIAGTVTDNAAFDPSDADLANCIGVIPISQWFDFNDNAVATRSGLGLAFKSNATSIFGALVTRSTPTFVGTSDIIVILEILQDA